MKKYDIVTLFNFKGVKYEVYIYYSHCNLFSRL